MIHHILARFVFDLPHCRHSPSLVAHHVVGICGCLSSFYHNNECVFRFGPTFVIAEVTVAPLTWYLIRGTLGDLVVLMLSMILFRVLAYARVAYNVSESTACVFMDKAKLILFVCVMTTFNIGWLLMLPGHYKARRHSHES